MRVGRCVKERFGQKFNNNKISLSMVERGLKSKNNFNLFTQTRSYSNRIETNVFQDFQVGAQKLKNEDYWNWYCCFFLPNQVRLHDCNLRAFNLELISKGTTSHAPSDLLGLENSQHMPTLLRLLWWKDVVNNIYEKGESPPHPIARSLTNTITTFKLPKIWVMSIINARIKDIETIQPNSLEFLEKYGDDTSGSLFRLTLECLMKLDKNQISTELRDTTEHCASHLGRAIGMTNLLRGTYHHLSKRKCYLPIDLMAKNNLSTEEIFRKNERRENSKELSNVIYEVATAAWLHLQKAEEMKKDIWQEAIPIFLTTEITRKYLSALQKADFNVYDSSLQFSAFQNLLLRLKIYNNFRKKTF